MANKNGIKLGNPAPLGLFAFGVTTALLMYVDAGWVEPEFEQFVAGYAIYYGGMCQIIVAIFELLKGSTFSGAVFGSYGAFWLGWAAIVFETHNADSTFVPIKAYPEGKAAWLATFGMLTVGFYPVILRKNMCLIVTFALLIATFFLLSAATATGNAPLKEAAGYVGFLCAFCAWYTGFAEIVNEEYGRMILPGLSPMVVASQERITKEFMLSRGSYNFRTNTLFLSFRYIQIKTIDDVKAIKDAVEEIITTNASKDNHGGKVHVMVDYDHTFIGHDVADEYWTMVQDLQERYYLSASRFHVSSFDTGLMSYDGVEAGSKYPTIVQTVDSQHYRPNESGKTE